MNFTKHVNGYIAFVKDNVAIPTDISIDFILDQMIIDSHIDYYFGIQHKHIEIVANCESMIHMMRYTPKTIRIYNNGKIKCLIKNGFLYTITNELNNIYYKYIYNIDKPAVYFTDSYILTPDNIRRYA